jgi:hypothetical protein
MLFSAMRCAIDARQVKQACSAADHSVHHSSASVVDAALALRCVAYGLKLSRMHLLINTWHAAALERRWAPTPA